MKRIFDSLPWIVLAIVCLAALLQVLPFAWVDYQGLNPWYTEAVNMYDAAGIGLGNILTTTWASVGWYRPVSAVLAWANWHIIGENRVAWRIEQSILHLIAMLLVGELAWRLTHDRWCVPLAAAMFGLPWYAFPCRFYPSCLSDVLGVVLLAGAALLAVSGRGVWSTVVGILSVGAREIALIPCLGMLPRRRLPLLMAISITALSIFGIAAASGWNPICGVPFLSQSDFLIERRWRLGLTVNQGLGLLITMIWASIALSGKHKAWTIPMIVVALGLVVGARGMENQGAASGWRYLYLPAVLAAPAACAGMVNSPARRVLEAMLWGTVVIGMLLLPLLMVESGVVR